MSRPKTPPPIIIPNCVQISLVFTATGRTIHNVLHGLTTAQGPLNPALATNIFAALKANTSFTAWMSGHVHTSVSFTGVAVKDMRAGNNPTLASSGTALVGGAAGTALPYSSALVVTLRTQFSGKQWRGRVYLGGLTTADMADPRTWSGTAGTAAVAMVNGIDAVFTTQQMPLALAQKLLIEGTDKHGNPLPRREAHCEDVISVDIANPRIDTQRNRLGR